MTLPTPRSIRDEMTEQRCPLMSNSCRFCREDLVNLGVFKKRHHLASLPLIILYYQAISDNDTRTVPILRSSADSDNDNDNNHDKEDSWSCLRVDHGWPRMDSHLLRHP